MLGKISAFLEHKTGHVSHIKNCKNTTRMTMT